MTPIGSTSSNIRRAIAFIVYSSCPPVAAPAPLAGTHDHLDDCAPPNSSHNDARRLTRRSLLRGDAEQRLTRCGGHSRRSHRSRSRCTNGMAARCRSRAELPKSLGGLEQVSCRWKAFGAARARGGCRTCVLCAVSAQSGGPRGHPPKQSAFRFALTPHGESDNSTKDRAGPFAEVARPARLNRQRC